MTAGLRKQFNPFYALLIMLGVLFSVTACAYGILVWQGMRLSFEDLQTARQSLVYQLIDRWGGMALTVELALLAVATLCAIALDDRRLRAAARQYQAIQDSRSGEAQP